MSNRLKYERFYWFHGRIKSGRYPNAARLVGERISVKNIEYSRVDGWCFRQTVQAMFDDSPLRITHHSPHSGKTFTRHTGPCHYEEKPRKQQNSP
ncbi:MAG: hypothetical protein M0P70_07595 [Desulfobulbaceae bacterium]|nr:hypothetical protein [Desulfobulbaceae bacterium]